MRPPSRSRLVAHVPSYRAFLFLRPDARREYLRFRFVYGYPNAPWWALIEWGTPGSPRRTAAVDVDIPPRYYIQQAVTTWKERALALLQNGLVEDMNGPA